jgi:hypothetical protein
LLPLLLLLLLQVSRSQLEVLAPMFGSITQQQIDLMVAAVNMLPPIMLQKLTGMVGGLGPVTNVQVANPQRVMTPVFSIGSGGGMRFGPWGLSFGGAGASGMTLGRPAVGGLSLGTPVRLGTGLTLGRKLQQDGCVPMLKVRRKCNFGVSASSCTLWLRGYRLQQDGCVPMLKVSE